MDWEDKFVSRLSEVSLPGVFNPYADRCDLHDLPAAASIRQRNLKKLLAERSRRQVDSIWFGRDLGYRGGRRTGIALTDEVFLHSTAFGVRDMSRATRGEPVSERTAAVIWSMIARLERPPVLWNAFPFHPHLPDQPFSNRAHTKRERSQTVWAIEELVTRFQNPTLIAIGNDASNALSDLGFKHVKVRHPSYGGQREFISGMEELHGIDPLQTNTEPKQLAIL